MDKHLERGSAFVLLLFTLPLIFLPKINLITFGEQTAGLRVDDLVLLAFAFICFFFNFAKRNKLLDIEKNIFAIVALSFVSCAINHLLVYMKVLPVAASYFYSFRLFEYFLFFYVGSLASRFYSISTLVKIFFVWNFMLMVLQKLQIVGIFSVEGYIAKPDDRMLGIASFGSEIGLLLNLLFCFLIYDYNIPEKGKMRLSRPLQRGVDEVYPYLLLLLFIVLVVLSGARMAIFALFVSFLFCIRERLSWRRPISFLLPLVALGIGSALMLYALYNASGIVSRSKGLLSFDNIDLISTVWNSIPLEYDPIGREAVRQGMHDASWWMRIHKWCYALKMYVYHPECWLQGVGPGFAMAALDGGFLRILTEVGILGSVLYGRLFYLIAIKSTQLYWMMVAFALNMIFFDVYLAYKPMSLLFLIVGSVYASEVEGDEAVETLLAPRGT